MSKKNTKDKSNVTHPLKDSVRPHDSLRLAASQVAALVGLHPFADVPQFAMDLVYQDNRPLLHRDASALGLTLVSSDQLLDDLARQAGPETLQALATARAVEQGTQRITSIQQATKIKQNVQRAAASASSLTRQQRAALTEGARAAVDTGFGTHHEAAALDRLAAQKRQEQQCQQEERPVHVVG